MKKYLLAVATAALTITGVTVDASAAPVPTVSQVRAALAQAGSSAIEIPQINIPGIGLFPANDVQSPVTPHCDFDPYSNLYVGSAAAGDQLVKRLQQLRAENGRAPLEANNYDLLERRFGNPNTFPGSDRPSFGTAKDVARQMFGCSGVDRGFIDGDYAARSTVWGWHNMQDQAKAIEAGDDLFNKMMSIPGFREAALNARTYFDINVKGEGDGIVAVIQFA